MPSSVAAVRRSTPRSARASESSLILERSKPCPHERVLEAPGRGRPGVVPAQEMLALERLERTLHRGARQPMPECRRGKLEPDRLLAHDPKRVLLGARQEEPSLQVADVLH